MYTSNGYILQFIYGEDGLDASKIEVKNGSLELIKMNNKEFNEKFVIDDKYSFSNVITSDALKRYNDELQKNKEAIELEANSSKR